MANKMLTDTQQQGKIAIFIPSLRGGGAERAMILFAECLLNFGYEVDLLVAQKEGALLPTLSPGIKVVDLHKKRVAYAVPSLIRYLKTNNPRAIFSTVINANVALLLAKYISGTKVPVIVREANMPNPSGEKLTVKRKLTGALVPLLYKLSDTIISVSKDVESALVKSLPSLKAKIQVLPNPVVLNSLVETPDPAPAHDWFKDNSQVPVVLGVGRLHPQKDFQTLISAFALVRAQRPAKLLILGEGAERPRLETLIESLGLSSDVSLPGYMPNPYPYYKRSNLFVLCSRYEGMPNVLLQAMSCGLPVISTGKSSGAKDIITSPELGTLVEVGDVQGLAREILGNLDKPRNLLAAKFVKERFSVEAATKSYLKAAGL